MLESPKLVEEPPEASKAPGEGFYSMFHYY